MAAVTFSPVVGTVLAIVALFFFPASVAIPGSRGHMLKALYPWRWFAVAGSASCMRRCSASSPA
jgi:hypothetical protein